MLTRPFLAQIAVGAVAVLALGAGLGSPAVALDAWHVLPAPTDRDLTKVDFVDTVRGWVVGDEGTILATSDGGESWTLQATPITEDLVDIRMFDTGTGWALGHTIGGFTWENHSTLLHTTNGGQDWTVQQEFDHLYWTLDFRGERHGILAGDRGEILLTADGGATWTPAVIDAKEDALFAIREVEFHSPTFVLALGGQYDVTGIVWDSHDGGFTWTHRRVAGEPMFGSHLFGEDEILCVGGDLDYGARTVRTLDGPTADWDQVDLQTWGQAGALAFRTDEEGWAPLGVAGTYLYTMDGGHTWTSQFSPGGTSVMDIVFPSETVGYMVGLDGAVLRYAGGTVTGILDHPTGAEAAGLELRNTPNPFRDRTTFSFQVARRSVVSLKIYNTSGREVATVVEDEFLPGAYTRDFEVGALGSGVYFSRISTDGKVETRRLVILK